MFTSLLYLLSFIAGVFIIWRLGREELYDEDKLIDLSLIATVAALVTARVSFFVWRPEEWVNVVNTNSLGWLVVRLFQLNTGAVWWVGGLVFFVTAGYFLWRWKWPQWPMLGILGLGLASSVVLKELLLWYWEGPSYGGLVLAGAILGGTVIVYVLKLGGEEKLKDQISKIKAKFKVKK